jgi:hypothetical protein
MGPPYDRTMTKSLWPLLLSSGILLTSAAPQTSRFTVLSSPNPNAAGDTLNAVAAIGTNDIWAVGYRGSNFPTNGTTTLVEHYDGTGWKLVPSPNPGQQTVNCPADETANVLNAVAGTSANDIWAVGYFFNCGSGIESQPLVLHWDGVQWSVSLASILSIHGNNALNSVVAISPNDVWAAGYQVNPANGGVITLIEHWTGGQWSIVTSPNANENGNMLNAISAVSATDVWAAGSFVDQPTNSNQTLIEHFDGVQWTVVPSPNGIIADLDQNILNGVVATSSTDVTAVGFVLNAAIPYTVTLIEHWDGAKWSIVPSPNVAAAAGDSNHLNAIAAVSATDIYAAGWFEDAATSGQHTTLIEHFDGTAWSIIPSPTKSLAQHLNGAAVTPRTQRVWAVGAYSLNGIDPEFGDLMEPRTLVLFSPIG